MIRRSVGVFIMAMQNRCKFLVTLMKQNNKLNKIIRDLHFKLMNTN